MRHVKVSEDMPDLTFKCISTYNMIFMITDVYLSLDDSVIPNHGYVEISDIGTAGDDTALLCITNRPPTGSGHSEGDWFAADGTRVRVSGNAVPGFRRSRGPMVVRLNRDTATGPPAEGLYQCQIQDDTNTLQTVWVGLYQDGGKYMYCCDGGTICK